MAEQERVKAWRKKKEELNRGMDVGNVIADET